MWLCIPQQLQKQKLLILYFFHLAAQIFSFHDLLIALSNSFLPVSRVLPFTSASTFLSCCLFVVFVLFCFVSPEAQDYVHCSPCFKAHCHLWYMYNLLSFYFVCKHHHEYSDPLPSLRTRALPLPMCSPQASLYLLLSLYSLQLQSFHFFFLSTFSQANCLLLLKFAISRNRCYTVL